MARINLLPWRAERRKAREREFYSMLGFAALGGVLLSVLIWFYYDAQISGQTERNAFLTAEIDKVKAQNEEIKELDKKKDRLLARKKVIEELQANRSQMVHLFDSLVRTIPDGVALTNIKQDGDILTLEGRSQSNARVSTYMRNLEGSGWMTNPDLSIIEAKSQDKAGQPAGPSMDTKTLPYVFTLKVKLANPNEADKNGTAPVDAQAPGATPATAPAGAPAAAPAPATSPAAAPAPVQPAPASANRPQEGAAS
ncbi:PilN domain-containing protein [Xanthomonas arboricola]|uniref:PilN domain-containing protein n=1 Tax=Xanthomonas arboricola TaxID=56448 RepID=UPI000C816FA6|nr:PilN domain-containing protein [Xanthomonas arboricola]NIJ85723.1 type IV pilus assembly protein PilN [Xanthomonas arboricola]PPU24263.1 fimbrial protein [Xanthomonas arboricola]SOU04354.1 fimbrial assembly membrane protein [Xanthomonas arboricola pv. fragariae]